MRTDGHQLSKDEINAVDEKVNQKISAAGSKSALNSALSAYGANVNVLREVYLAGAKLTALQTYLFGDNGVMKVTDAELDAYYKRTTTTTSSISSSSPPRSTSPTPRATRRSTPRPEPTRPRS